MAPSVKYDAGTLVNLMATDAETNRVTLYIYGGNVSLNTFPAILLDEIGIDIFRSKTSTCRPGV